MTILYILYYSRRIHTVSVRGLYVIIVRVDVCSRFTHIHIHDVCNILGIEPTHSIVGFQDMALVVVHLLDSSLHASQQNTLVIILIIVCTL